MSRSKKLEPGSLIRSRLTGAHPETLTTAFNYRFYGCKSTADSQRREQARCYTAAGPGFAEIVVSMPFNFISTAIPDVVLIEPVVHEDGRGFFLESFKQSEFGDAGIDVRFVQDNHSRSRRGTLRGLHFQTPPHEQGKLVRVASGAVLDVAVDIRVGSPWYGRHVAIELSDTNHRALWIPVGFAHGFCALEDATDVLYKVTAEYSPASEAGLFYADPALGVDWRLPADSLIVSDKDRRLPRLGDYDSPFIHRGAG